MPNAPPSLWELANRQDVDEPTVLAALMSDPTTAKFLVAWRRSVQELKEARSIAIANGGENPAPCCDDIQLDVRRNIGPDDEATNDHH